MTSAVITEAMHFVAPARGGALLLAELVAKSGLQVLDFSHAEDLMEAARRMEKYRDIPMDYADATRRANGTYTVDVSQTVGSTAMTSPGCTVEEGTSHSIVGSGAPA